MKKVILCIVCCACICAQSSGQEKKAKAVQPLFTSNLSNAVYDKNVWSIDKKGILSATADDMIWTMREYENFEISLEFKNDHCTNSGVIIYCTNKRDWIPNSVEIQIADDYCAKWTDWSPVWRCGAVFGHLGPSQPNLVKKPGKWNKMKITAKEKNIVVVLNGKKVIDMDMNLWISGKNNPDGSEIPSWLPKPFAELPTKGYIGFQGKHGEALIWFRNIKIKEL
jgi:hypothetical protein